MYTVYILFSEKLDKYYVGAKLISREAWSGLIKI